MVSDGKNNFLLRGLNNDVVKNVLAHYERHANQTAELVAELRECSPIEACEAVFWYVIDNVRYKEDEGNKQFIKSPARLLADGVGDCKSMSIFVASCLHCLGIKHAFRFVNFYDGKQYTHVYVVADCNGEIIIIDPVEKVGENKEPMFNFARKFSNKKDFWYL